MKNRLISILLMLLFSTTFAFAQENMKFSIAILGGANLQNINGKAYNGDKLNNDMLPSYHFGADLQIPVAPEFYFQPGLMYIRKGDKNTSSSSTSTTSLSYIEIPLNMVYKAALGKGFFMIGLGPYLAYGISGSVKTVSGSLTLDQKITFKKAVGSEDNLLVPYYKPFDAGANLLVGYELEDGVFIQLDSQFGLLNINPEYKGFTDDQSSAKNTGFGLSLGYRF